MINRKFLYESIKSPEIGMFAYLNQKQVAGIEAILTAWDNSSFADMRWLAYMLATVFHETAQTMQPIEEYGKGRKYAYGVPDPVTGKTYYGRGLVQLTWKRNYEKMGSILGVDLVNYPERACESEIAVKILFEGMTKAKSSFGDFTGKSLENYFSGEKICDWINARKIINGLDRAQDIARYAKNFLKSISTI
jgi:putative chitinase